MKLHDQMFYCDHATRALPKGGDAFPTQLLLDMRGDAIWHPTSKDDHRLIEQLIRFVERRSEEGQESDDTFDTPSDVLRWLETCNKERFAVPGGAQVVKFFLDRMNARRERPVRLNPKPKA
jgi:hypothetical protein